MSGGGIVLSTMEGANGIGGMAHNLARLDQGSVSRFVLDAQLLSYLLDDIVDSTHTVPPVVSTFGCGDGGLYSTVKTESLIECATPWGGYM